MRKQWTIEPIAKRVFLRGIRKYLRRDFHPDHDDNYGLAAELLARAEAARVELAGTVAP
jgi:predicted metal-dependent hydrolase